VVCVYNNEDILKVALLRSLESQSAKFELILLDNRDARYKSAAQASTRAEKGDRRFHHVCSSRHVACYE